uniref:Peroxisomal ATPase PEX6 n=1 Tax=Pygocentrus nattereri TaxID=42514 RepID=A0AAR2LAX3_PYGNA
MLTVRETQPSRKSGFLVCAHVTAEEQIDGSALSACSNDSALGVYVSKTFLLHYELQENMRGTVRPLQLLPLNRIVIGARTKQSFKWASSEKFSSVLLVLASCHKQTLMARQGDVLVLPYHPFLGDDTTQINQYMSDLVVLECTPVTQGMITIHTSVVVSDCRDLLLSHAMLDLFVNPLSRPSNLSLFASDFAHYANSLGPGSSLLNNKLLISSGFTGFLQALECRLDVKVVDVVRLYRQGKLSLRVEQGAEVDTDSMIFVSKNLLLKLGLFNGEWVVSALCPPLGKGKKSSRTELVQSPGGAENESISKFTAKARGDVHLAKIMAFNWDRFTDMDAGDNVGFISPAPSETRLKLSASACCSAAPSYAKELHIEAVISPDYNSYGPFDDILFKHFTTPRLVQQGLMLGIPVQGCPEFVESSTDGVTRWPVLYFKVKQVTGFSEEEGEVACYLADTDHTSLYMVRVNSDTTQSKACHKQHNEFILSSEIGRLCLKGPRGCSVLLVGPNGSGKVTAIKAACRRLHLHLLKVDCVTLCGDTAAACESKMKAVFHKAELHHPCVLLLRNLQLLSQRRDGTEMDSRVVSALCQLIPALPMEYVLSHCRVIVVGTVSDQRDVFADVMAAFVHQVAMESHSEEQRKAILTSLTEDITLAKDASLAKIAKQTAVKRVHFLWSLGLVLYTNLFGLLRSYPHGASAQEEEDLCVCGVTIMAADFTKALESLQEAHSQAIGAPKIPSVRWQDVGGLQHVKKEILDTIQLPLEHPELLSLDLRRSGLLLYGPPGTGKTLLAKAVATECSMTFLSVKGPEVINMYVGQSEENIREVFSKARAAAPCIVFFDELDSLAPNRGRSGDSGGVMDRVVSQLLAELDGLHSSSDVFVIGATNRPDLLDHSLLRPGRFDKLVYVGINEDRESQLQVLKAIVRKFKVDPTVNLSDIVEQCPPQLTGADVYALCSDAMMFAIKRKILRISEGLESEDSVLTLCAEDFSQALDVLQPSVSEQELHKYKLIQQKFTTK